MSHLRDATCPARGAELTETFHVYVPVLHTHDECQVKRARFTLSYHSSPRNEKTMVVNTM